MLSGDGRLWRRIHPLWYVTSVDTGQRSITSQAYQNGKSSDHMSVSLADRQDAPKSPEEAVSGKYDGYGLVEFSIAFARSLEQGVSHTPTQEEPAHGSVTGKKTNAVKNALKAESTLLVKPRLQA